MTRQTLSRRSFLKSTARTAPASVLVLTLPMVLAACREAQQARLDGADFQVLSQEEAAEFDAISARIVPSDDTAGAREAGVIYFIDTVMREGRDREMQALRDGLREFQTQIALSFGAPYFHELNEAEQDTMLGQIEATPFFATVRMLTIAGLLSLPEYGGNRDFIGYQLIGYDSRAAWSAPYGFYDADYMERGE